MLVLHHVHDPLAHVVPGCLDEEAKGVTVRHCRERANSLGCQQFCHQQRPLVILRHPGEFFAEPA